MDAILWVIQQNPTEARFLPPVSQNAALQVLTALNTITTTEDPSGTPSTSQRTGRICIDLPPRHMMTQSSLNMYTIISQRRDSPFTLSSRVGYPGVNDLGYVFIKRILARTDELGKGISDILLCRLTRRVIAKLNDIDTELLANAPLVGVTHESKLYQLLLNENISSVDTCISQLDSRVYDDLVNRYSIAAQL
tara:strand:- start:317 stop:895 length:579 start_codon:yes stop_codon:yes gene_type:complete